jgi:hypothetical protein
MSPGKLWTNLRKVILPKGSFDSHGQSDAEEIAATANKYLDRVLAMKPNEELALAGTRLREEDLQLEQEKGSSGNLQELSLRDEEPSNHRSSTQRNSASSGLSDADYVDVNTERYCTAPNGGQGGRMVSSRRTSE